MHPIVRNVLAVLAGLLVGSAVNMGLVLVSGTVIPPPPGEGTRLGNRSFHNAASCGVDMHGRHLWT